MRSVGIVERLERGEFSPEIRSSPERHLIKILAPQCADQPFHEGVRERHVGHGLDFPDLQHSQVRSPAMKFEERIVIGADMAGQGAAAS